MNHPNAKHPVELRIVRVFEVAPETVFDAVTRPEAMRVWWTDDTTFDMDLRVGGIWRIVREDAGETYVMDGEYLEVEKPNRLRYTIGMPQYSPNRDTVTLDIRPNAGGGCRVTFIQSGPDISAELESLEEGEASPSEMGWQQGFDLMEAAWSRH